MWPHVNDRSVLQAYSLHSRTLFLLGLHIPGLILIPSSGDPACAVWYPHSSDTLQEMNSAKQPESGRRDRKHEVVNLQVLQDGILLTEVCRVFIQS